MRWVSAGLLIALALARPGNAWAACTVNQRAMVTLERAGTLLIVPLMLNDQPARFLLDTGAERTVVTTDAARRLGLARDEWVATTMRAANGAIERNRNANPRSISLGGVALRHHSVARDSSLAVTTPTVMPGTDIDGFLGRDFLGSFDLSLDLQAGTLRLFDVSGCSGRFLPWTGSYVELPVIDPARGISGGSVTGTPDASALPYSTPGSTRPARAQTGSTRGGEAPPGGRLAGGALIVRAEVDGVPLRALLDTGASRSLIAATGIYRLELTSKPSDMPTRIGMSAAGRPMDGRLHRFNTFRIGTEVERSAELLVAPVRVVPTADMILGADWFTRRSVWISFSTGQVFVTPRS